MTTALFFSWLIWLCHWDGGTCHLLEDKYSEGGLVLIIYRPCSMMRRRLEVKLIGEVFLSTGSSVECLNIYYGLHTKDKTYFGFLLG